VVSDLDVEPVGLGGRASGGLGGHDDDLMPAIDRVWKRTGAGPGFQSLTRVGVSVGPGGYTSTRVACAVGKMIAEASGAECVAVPTADAVLEAAGAEMREGRVAIALASKGETVWLRMYENGGAVGAGGIVDVDTAASIFQRGVTRLIADRHLPAKIRTIAADAGVRIVEPVFDAGACARVAARLSPVDPAELVPIYPREPDAVTLWRAKKKA
jgi:tRNA A37 threonylcarbamoyladenosine modification protein TsaB